MQSKNKVSCSGIAELLGGSKAECASDALANMQMMKLEGTTTPTTTCLIASLDASAREFYTLCAEAQGMELEEWLDYQPF
ncbi:MAG: hypothetical protein RR068_17215 [Hafnia sp.]